MVHRKGRSEVAQLRFFANIHASMFRVPYIGKCFFVVCRAGAQLETRHGHP